jgi:hypothetical protein
MLEKLLSKSGNVVWLFSFLISFAWVSYEAVLDRGPLAWLKETGYKNKFTVLIFIFMLMALGWLAGLLWDFLTRQGIFARLEEAKYGKPKKSALQVNPNPESSCAVCGSSLPNLHMYQTMDVVGGSWGYCDSCKKLFCKNHSKTVDVCYYEGEVEYTESHCPDCDNHLKTPSIIWRKNL